MASEKIDKKGAVSKLLDATQKLAACPVDSQKWEDAFKDVTRAFTTLRDTASNSMTSSIGDFFRNVGSGLIDAQKKLDEESESYVRSALQRDRAGSADSSIPPTASTFRIPRVNAELKCSLETNSEQKLNLIFYSDRNEAREMHQQTVQLEIVAVPAPADYINYLQKTDAKRPAPAAKKDDEDDGGDDEDDDKKEKEENKKGVTMVDANGAIVNVPTKKNKPIIFSDDGSDEPEEKDEKDEKDEGERKVEPEEQVVGLPQFFREHFASESARDEARQILEALDQKQNGLRRTLVKDLLLPFWSHALIFTDGKNDRFIALAVQGKRPELLLWQLAVEPAALQLIYRLPVGARRDLLVLQRLVLAFGKAANQNTRATKNTSTT